MYVLRLYNSGFLLFVAGGEKLGIKAVLDEDGTEIEDDYLEILEPNNIVILLEQQENWTEKDNCCATVSEVQGKIIMHSLIHY